jgi:ribosomal protein S27E
MPRAPQNRIGQVFRRWRIIKENQRGIAMDHGKLRAKTRFFAVECTNCGYIKDNISYKNIYYDKISHKDCKTEYEKSFDRLLNGKRGYKIVGKPVYNERNQRYIVLSITIPPEGKYPYKTLEYEIKCESCNKKHNVTYHSLSHGQYAVCACNNNTNKEVKTRNQIVNDINDEFIWMMELNKEGQLINYLKNKFPDEEWDKILEEEY